MEEIRQYCENPNCTVDTILNRVKRFQVHEVNQNRKTLSEYYHLFPILKKYEDKFVKYTRMKLHTFDYILAKIGPSLDKNWCNFHTQPIVPEERFVITLRFLATGSSYSDLSFTFRMGEATISNLLHETMSVLWKELCPLHMPIPSQEKFSDIAQDFYSLWNMPHCIGAIDGCHIRIKKPPKSGTLYYNYKKFFSIVLQAVVDAKYKFIFIDVGGYGHQHDATTFRNSTVFAALKDKTIKIPQDDELPGSHIILPYFFVGDGAYPLSDNLMKPYRGVDLPADQKTFNKRLSRARVTVECAFGQMCQRWRIFYTTIQQLPESVEVIVKAACILHNAIIDLELSDFNFATSQENFIELSAVNEQDTLNDFTVGLGKEVRDELTKYMMQGL